MAQESTVLPSPFESSDDRDSALDSVAPPARLNLLQRFLRDKVLAMASGLREGRMVVHEDGRTHRFGPPHAELRATVEVVDPKAWPQIALGGTIGFAESYMDGHVRIDDPVSLVRIFVRDRDSMNSMEVGLARFAMHLLKFWHGRRENTRSGSRKNIAEHYDLGNDFYRLWLDPTMMYSAAIWEDPSASLEEAQLNKLRRICRKLALEPHHHLLEVGSGWGSMAILAAKEFGCKVTTTTISSEQHLHVLERVRQEGLEDKIQVLFQDYRDLRGQYDRVVSIEMIEAVGWRYFGTYFNTLSRLLKPDGLALIQSITIADRHYEQAKRSVDFIQRHIFPGSCIPSLSALFVACREKSDLTPVHLEDIGSHYARTLRHWREAFLQRRVEIQKLGYSPRFQRMWEWYLAYCEGGFEERQIGDAQILLAKPSWRGDHVLGNLTPNPAH